MRLVPLFAIGALACPGFCHGQWEQLNSGTSETILTLSRTPGGTLRAMGGEFLESTDGGDTWTAWTPTLNGLIPLVGGYFRDIVWTDENTGYMVGGMNTNNQHVVLQTNDGGLDWHGLDVSYTAGWPQFNTQLQFMEFPMQNIGYVCGRNGSLRKTTNGGGDWIALGTGTASNISAMHFWDANTGIIVSETDIRRTTNGGLNWAPVATGTNMGGLGWLPSGEMFSAGDSTFYTSVDMGATWTTNPTPLSSALDIMALSPDTILMAGDGIWISRDGGQWWEHFPEPANSGFYQMVALGPQTVIAAGNDGRIIRTTNAGGPSMPTPDFDHSIAYACGEAVLDLSADCDPALALTWLVDGNPVSTATTHSITYTAANNGDIIALVADNGEYTDTLVWYANVQVDQPITVDAGADVAQCYGAVAQLQASGATTYSWSPSTGLSSTAIAAPTSSVQTPITYTVTGTTGLCSDTDSVHVFVEPNQAPDAWMTLLYTTDAANMFYGMHWLDDHNGYVFGLDNLLITHDGGATWESHLHNLNFNGTMLDMDMLDTVVGYMTTSNILKTTDGGASWTQLNNSGWQPWGYDFTSLEFLNRDTGIVVAQSSGQYAWKIYRTVDGGANWEPIFESPGPPLHALAVLDWNTIIAVGGNGASPPRIVRTADAGVTWSDTLHAAGAYSLHEIAVSPDGTVVAVGADDEYRSTDSGATWQRRSSDAGAKGELAFTTADVAYCGEYSTVYKSVNGGACYQQVNMAMPNSILAVEASGPDRVHVACRTAQNAGTLVRSTGDIPLRVASPAPRPAQDFMAWHSQADDAWRVRCPEQWAHADLTILDAQGRIVARERWTRGTDRLGSDPEVLAPGQYLLRAVCGDEQRATKLILH